MDDATVHAEGVQRNEEDYTGAVCWLLPRGQHTLIDVEDIPLLERYHWYVHTDCRNGRESVVRKRTNSGCDRTYYLSREITSAPPRTHVDHRNHRTKDNRRGNLRVCTHQQNSWNSLKHRRRTSSRFKGVYLNQRPLRKRWYAYVSADGRRHFLGYFATEEEAARAYNEAARMHFGEFAHLNSV